MIVVMENWLVLNKNNEEKATNLNLTSCEVISKHAVDHYYAAVLLYMKQDVRKESL